MKKVFLLTCIVFAAINFAVAQTPATNPNAPKITFDHDSHDFKTVIEGPKVTHVFKFKNDGKEPLILSNVKASCGCTTPEWPKEPIMPGKTSQITAVYNTQNRVGDFTKTITVESNATEGTKVLTIKGKVIRPEEDNSLPVASPSMLAPK